MQTSKRVSLETYLKPYQLSAFSVSEDESYIVYGTNITGAYNLWKMELSDNRVQTQLTFHNEKIESIAVSNETIFFTSDKSGNENMHIFSIHQNGENWKDIRSEENCRYFFGGISEDGSKLYYTSTKDNPMYLSVFSYDLQTDKEILLHKGNGAETYLLSVRPNSKDFAYFVRYNHSDMKIFVKKDEQDIELIPETTQQYRVADLCFINEDKVLFSTSYGEEFTYLASYDLSTGLFQKVVEIEKQDIEKIHYHATMGKVFLETKAGPIGCLYVYDMESNSLVDLQIPTDTIQQCMVTQKGTIYLIGASSTKPPTLFQKRVEGQWEILLENKVPYVSESELIRPIRINYQSFDGLEIEAMFYEAKEEYRNGHTIVYPHGGPQYNEQTDYYGYFQYLLRCGFHIFAPNFRGTPNYGTSFLKLIEGDWGGGS